MVNKIPLAYADVELQLSSAISVGDTSFTLSSATDDDGVALPAGKYCFTIDNGTSAKEYLIGQLNGTTVTSVVSVSRQGAETSGAARAHRVGAPAILTDFATIQRVAAILTGTSTLDGASPVSYDTEPTLSSDTQLATVGYVLDVVNGGTVTFDSQTIIPATAGETFSQYSMVYFDEADQEWKKTDADNSTMNTALIGVAQGAGSDGVAISGGVKITGVHTNSGFSAGSKYYLSNTAGVIDISPGTNSVFVGWGLSSTKLLLAPKLTQIPTGAEKAALAGDSTPSATNPYVTKIRSMTAGATINGATLPVPVYQNTTDNEYYACDGNDTAALKFQGFAVSNGTDGNSINIQYTGIVSGFSGLDEGLAYYLSDTVGTIQNTPGTYSVMVGIAISPTQLLIRNAPRRLNGGPTDVGTASGSTVVTSGFRPAVIRIHAHRASTTNIQSNMSAIWVNGTLVGASNTTDSDSGQSQNTARFYGPSQGDYMDFTITNVTNTGFTITWTETGTFTGSAYFVWEAEGDF